MSRTGLLAIAFAGHALIASPALAQDAPSNSDNGRFSLFRVEEGYLRLDGRTGQMSNCVRRQSRWLCQTVPEERIALESEIARLQADNAALKRELLAHQLPPPQGVQPDLAHSPAPQSRGPADRELDRVGAVIKGMWRRVVAFVVSVQRDLLDRS